MVTFNPGRDPTRSHQHFDDVGGEPVATGFFVGVAHRYAVTREQLLEAGPALSAGDRRTGSCETSTSDEIETLYGDARALHVDGITVSYELPPSRRRAGGPLISELLTSNERWRINTTKLRKDALWKLLIGLASVATWQAFLSLGAGLAQIRGIAEKITRNVAMQ